MAPPSSESVARHTIAVIVDNEPGVLARVVGLFSGRGYNIESLTVAAVSADGRSSRINLVTTGTPMIVEQIKAQLQRLVPVQAVRDLTAEGPHIQREVALVKVVATGAARLEVLRVADIFRARATDTTVTSFVFAITGAPEKIDSFIELMHALGSEVEIARSGVVAMARGATALPAAGRGGDRD